MMRFISVLTLILLLSCSTDGIDLEMLQGKWVVHSAERGGKLTETLNGAFFEFSGDSLSTNFTGEVEQIAFRCKEKSIIPEGKTYQFEIMSLDREILQMQSTIRDTEFRFYLERSKEQSHQ